MLLLVLMLMLMIESVYPRFFPQKFRPPGKPFQHSHKHIYDSNETLFLRNQLLRDNQLPLCKDIETSRALKG